MEVNCSSVTRIATASVLIALAGCGVLRPKASEQPAFYSLDGAVKEAPTATRGEAIAGTRAPTLVVNPPRAAPGFDSPRIIYVREAHQLEYYAHSEWVDSPARMLAPLAIAAVGNSGAFAAVVPTPSAAAGDFRLDTEIIRLQHELTSQPSRVRFTLRAYVADSRTREVLAAREFDESVATTSETPYGAVIAASRAVQTVLAQLAAFCAEAAVKRPPGQTDTRAGQARRD